ncbi:hypothetical protein MHYP_G00102650 [Metynnis hypsauchen]
MSGLSNGQFEHILLQVQEDPGGLEPTIRQSSGRRSQNCLSPAERDRDMELHVEAPEEVTEGETADLTCNTTCSLTDPTFIWYKDGRPLTTKTIKKNQLHLQTVCSEDAGSYSCAVRGDQHLHSTAHSLRVRSLPEVNKTYALPLLDPEDDVLYTNVTHSRSRPAQTADSGPADVLYATVRVQNDEVTSTDQQGEPQYASVTFLKSTAAPG